VILLPRNLPMSSLSLPSVAPQAEPPAPLSAGFPALARFFVQARPEPGVMPRLLELFAKRGLVPRRWHSTLGAEEAAMLTIEIEAAGLASDTVAYVADCMRGIAGVERVASTPASSG
jgi:hypothetical protein